MRYRTGDGRTGELRAVLTVACDGRGSLARGRPELGLRRFDCPMDAWWFRLPRREMRRVVSGGPGDRLAGAASAEVCPSRSGVRYSRRAGRKPPYRAYPGSRPVRREYPPGIATGRTSADAALVS
ncbi:hypothetical protein [Streptomyces cellostaticus]|uniref:hypothetical protein n=1 Tax=Streptomyces cellostaticus TaxID=67285 RepID=UPI002542276A|nr:hypothetical protein [Streptomyces cellostaticus]